MFDENQGRIGASDCCCSPELHLSGKQGTDFEAQFSARSCAKSDADLATKGNDSPDVLLFSDDVDAWTQTHCRCLRV